MTRAKTDLHLIAPLRYYVTQQSRRGDQHVYGAKSRFMTRAVMARLQQVSWPPADATSPVPAAASAPVDVAGRLRAMW